MYALNRLGKLKYKWNGFIKNHLRRVTIFKRLNTSFLLLILGTAVFLTFFSFYKYSGEIMENLQNYVTLSVQNMSLKVQDIMKEYEDTALKFYNDRAVVGAAAENLELSDKESADYINNKYVIERKLYELSRDRRYIKNIQFVSPKEQYHMVEDGGYQRGGTIRDLEGFYKSSFYMLPQENHGYPVWIDGKSQSEIFYENEQSVYGMADIMTMGVAIYEPSVREFLGVLLLNIDITAFSEAAGYDTSKGGNTFLIGEQGVLLAFNPNLAFPSFPKKTALMEEMYTKQSDLFQTDMEGREVLIAYEKIPSTQIFSAYIGDMDTLLAGTYKTRNLCVAVLCVVVIACFALSYYVTCSITEPVRKLVKVMDKAGSGKWSVRYNNGGNDEITELGNRFNEMADKTNMLIEQVYVSEIRRQKLQLGWKNAQLDALQMQINPHFLYNTLDIIRWEAMYEAGGESKVTRMIEKFSRLCRMGMKTDGYTVSLEEGLCHAEVYLEIINFRHAEKIVLKKDISEAAMACFVPQFMLQPIIENAVVHGFNDASWGCCIEIRAVVSENDLHIHVADNGIGMTRGDLELLRRRICDEETMDKSIGMANVNQRIQLFYGKNFGINIDSVESEGTDVHIVLPVRKFSENMKGFSGEGDV